jgi:hypothetical protein
MDFAKTARNVAIARVAWAFARDRLAAQLPGVEPRKQRSRTKTLLIGGGIAAVLGAALFKKREAVRGLLPGGESSEPPRPEAYTPPPVSNYDAPGPVANTATAVPVPPAHEAPAIDEAEEEAAAAAEAANIGGPVSDYAGPELGEVASEAERPLAEAGQGEAEGQEQTEAELRAAAEPTAPGMSDEQRQIEEAIEQQHNPIAPEQVEPVKPADDSEWKTWSGKSVNP